MSGRQILSQSLPAERGAIPAAREAVCALAQGAGMDGEQLENLRLVVSEAVSNVVLHAYGDGVSGAVHLTAALAGAELWVLVADDGLGLRPRSDSPGLGLGLSLIAQLAEELAIERRSGGGTELRIRFTLKEPAPAPRPGPPTSLDAGRGRDAGGSEFGVSDAGPREGEHGHGPSGRRRRRASGSPPAQRRGSVSSAMAPPSPSFSTTK